MIKIRKLVVSGFRGVRRQCTLDFDSDCKSMVVFGANAKGKTSLVDAFEWFYKGSIPELRREGCTKADYRHRLLTEQESALVRFELSNPLLNSDLILPADLRQRHSNDTPQFESYLEASKGDLLVLRHKELKRFVDETKGNKRKEVAGLMGLERWEDIRNDLLYVANQLSSELERIDSVIHDRRREVARLLGKEDVGGEEIWQFARDQCRILGLDIDIVDLASLSRAAELAAHAAVTTERSSLLRQLEVTKQTLEKVTSQPPKADQLRVFQERYNSLCADPRKVLALRLRQLLEQGLSVISSADWYEDSCPLCGNPVLRQELVKHIEDHLTELDEAKEEHDLFNRARPAVEKQLEQMQEVVESISSLGLEEMEPFAQIKETCTQVALASSRASALAGRELEAGASMDMSELALEAHLEVLVDQARRCEEAVKARIKSLAPSKEEIARVEAAQRLSNLTTHLSALEELEQKGEMVDTQAESVRRVATAFQDLRRDTMGAVLEAISEDVSRYFLALHPNEDFDDIELVFLPEEDGVEFDLYYRGEEISPPRKFLSESYINSLGICLFLATARAFNRESGFLVLDDIVNSFDAEHRAELARLLSAEFEDQQLIILTHDEIWFELFRRLTGGAGWKYHRILDWSYEDGISLDLVPADHLAELQEVLGSRDVGSAAPKVRAYIENRLKTLNEELGVRMRFRRGIHNDERTVSELLGDMRSHLNQRRFVARDSRCLRELAASTFVVNYGSHDRTPSAAALSVGDIEFALDRMLEVESLFTCDSCGRPVWSVRDRNFEMNCRCGGLSM